MTTLEHQKIDSSADAAPTRHSSRPWTVTVLTAVIALLVGAFAGWMVRGDGSDPDIVLAGDGELTARQEQMVDFMRDYSTQFQEGDVEALRDLFVDSGVLVALDTTYRVGEAGFDDFVGSGWMIENLEPMLVTGNDLLSFHEYDDVTYMNAMTFTSSGELLLVRHEISD